MFKNKKSQFFMMILVVVTLISFSVLYAVMISKVRLDDKTIGERQHMVLKTYLDMQSHLFYLDESADIASDQVLYELSKQGGIAVSECGDYFGYNLWNKGDKDCRPLKTEEAFSTIFNQELDKHLLKYDGIEFPSNNYQCFTMNDRFYCNAKKPLKIDMMDKVKKKDD